MKLYLSVVVPAFNEELNIKNGCLDAMYDFLSKEEFFAKWGLDPARKLITYTAGTERIAPFDPGSARNHIPHQIGPLAGCPRITAFTLDDKRIADFLLNRLHETLKRALLDIVPQSPDQGFTCFYQISFLRIRRRTVKALHTGHMTGGEVLAFIMDEFLQLLR